MFPVVTTTPTTSAISGLSAGGVSNNLNPAAIIANMKVAQSIDEIVVVATDLIHMPEFARQHFCLVSMGFSEVEAQELLELVARAQEQGVPLGTYSKVQRVVDEMFVRLDAYAIISKHQENTSDVVFGDVTRLLQKKTLQAARKQMKSLKSKLRDEEQEKREEQEESVKSSSFGIGEEQPTVDEAVAIPAEKKDLTDGLVAHYEFNADLTDSSGQGNHGQAVGGAFVADRFGNQNSAYRFNGTACILVKDHDSLDIKKDITLAAWYKTNNPILGGGIDNSVARLIAKHFTHDLRAYDLSMWPQGNASYTGGMSLIRTDNTFDNAAYPVSCDDSWHLLIASYDYTAGDVTLYIDGVLVKTQHFGQMDLMQTSVPLTLGCYLLSEDGSVRRGHYSGDLDDIRVYGRRLSQEEVMLLWAAFSASPTATTSPSGSVTATGSMTSSVSSSASTSESTSATESLTSSGTTTSSITSSVSPSRTLSVTSSVSSSLAASESASATRSYTVSLSLSTFLSSLSSSHLPSQWSSMSTLPAVSSTSDVNDNRDDGNENNHKQNNMGLIIGLTATGTLLAATGFFAAKRKCTAQCDNRIAPAPARVPHHQQQDGVDEDPARGGAQQANNRPSTPRTVWNLFFLNPPAQMPVNQGEQHPVAVAVALQRPPANLVNQPWMP